MVGDWKISVFIYQELSDAYIQCDWVPSLRQKSITESDITIITKGLVVSIQQI